MLHNGKVINGDGTSIEKIYKGTRRFNPLRKNIEIYYVEKEKENFVYSINFLKDVIFYLLINLIFIVIIVKLLLKIVYQPIKLLISKIDYEKPAKEDELQSIENIYDKLKTENDLLKNTSRRTKEITQGKELVDYIKGTLDFKHLTHPFKGNKKKYKMLVGIVEINDYSDDKVVSFKQEISKIILEKYEGVFELVDRGEILLLMEKKYYNIEKLKKDLYNLDEKYDMNIRGFISDKEFFPKELYNKYICFKNFLDYKFILREKKVITESDIDGISIRNYYYPIEAEKKID